MFEKPTFNRDVDIVADRVKHGYVSVAEKLAAMQYRLAELVGTGQLDADESMSLQEALVDTWEALYAATLCAVHDEDCTVDSDVGDGTYSDGRPVITKIRIGDEESSDFSWEHNQFLLGDGAVNDYPRGIIWVISPVDPAGPYVIKDPRRPSVSVSLRRRILAAKAATEPAARHDQKPNGSHQLDSLREKLLGVTDASAQKHDGTVRQPSSIVKPATRQPSAAKKAPATSRTRRRTESSGAKK